MACGNERPGNCTADNDAAEVEVELEAMRKEDFSWHPCTVSPCSTGVGLMVEYSNDKSDPDDIILSTEEAVARLRIRSAPLEGVACSIVQPGDRVLARRNRMNLFFDAEVIEVVRVRHSKRIHCRCTFTVKWIHNGLEGETEIIPSSGLMKMSTESIHLHPTIFAFFNTLLTSSCFDVSPLRAVAEGMDCEMDIDELEKQIEQISNSADACRMKITKVLSGEVDVDERSQCNLIPASEVCDTYIHLPPSQNSITGSTGGAQLTRPVETEFKHPPPHSWFTEEASVEGRSRCNPIAACAALASLMSKSSENTPTMSFISNSSKINDENFLGTESGTVTSISTVKELFPSKKLFKDPETLNASSVALNWESKNKESSQEVASCVGNHVRSTKKMCLAARSSSAMNRSPFENVEMPVTNARRLTRSVIRAIKEKQTVETKNVTEEILCSTFEQNLSVQKMDTLPDMEMVASVIDKESGLTISVKSKTQMDSKGICENNGSVMRSNGVGIQGLNNSRRLTRSAVKGKSKDSNGELPKGLEECSYPGHSKSDLEGNITSEREVPEMEKTISTSPVHETCPNPSIAEAYEKVQLSASIKTTRKTEGNATDNVSLKQGVKRKSSASKNQELRSSPRLRSLPRTLSQTRS